MSDGKIRNIEFEGAISGVNELGEFIQDNEEAFVPLKIRNNLILDMIKSGAELEPRELESTEDEGKRWVQHEQFRLLYVYFKDMSSESLLTPKKEVYGSRSSAIGFNSGRKCGVNEGGRKV